MKKNSDILCVVENQKVVGHMQKMLDFHGSPISELLFIADLVDMVYNKTGNYIVSESISNRSFPQKEQFDYLHVCSLHIGQDISPNDVVKKLIELDYSFADYEEKGSFQLQGDNLRITARTGKSVSVSFFGDSIESFSHSERDIFSFGRYASLEIFPESVSQEDSFSQICMEIKQSIILLGIDFYRSYMKFLQLGSHVICLNNMGEPGETKDLEISDLLLDTIDGLHALFGDESRPKYIYSKSPKTIENFIELNNFRGIYIQKNHINLAKSFTTPEMIVLCDDILSKIFIKKRIKRSLAQNMDLLLQMKPGDYVVHIDHGIGIFTEILEKELSGIKKEYMAVEYALGDKLFVPISEVSRVSKYVGSEHPKLTPLSTKQWEQKIKKANGEVEALAGELLEIYAKRKLHTGFAFKPFPEKEEAFVRTFEYTYTDDQSQVVREIYQDMEDISSMDRLVSGDVGFGKTEIAFASMYKAFINGKQSALISPLVVLAYEHFDKAKQRFAQFGIRIEVVTRFESIRSVNQTLKKLADGKIDVLIGTHRLLSADVVWKDLGLLVIDEEHKFGVKDKEKIKKFKGNIDILSLSATPIPRSLNMALSGIKSVSLLTTPPLGRQPISTMVAPLEASTILQAGKREFARGGQLFFIHNRVATIDAMQVYLAHIFPGKRIIVTHGQLPGDQLEQRILAFKTKQYDILLSTTVIENGIDFPNVNTIFINKASHFGIGQIHQLRGRVGRSDRQGYCYLLFERDKIAHDAAKRLKTMVDYSHLGAGFELAIKDLEIRGGGDILGMRQSGQSVEIGINLYMEMLEDKVEELKRERFPEEINTEEMQRNKRVRTTIDLHMGAYIDEGFFSGELDKLNFYREIESLDAIADLKNLKDDFLLINASPPQETLNFFDLLELKLLANSAKVSAIKRVGINYQIDFHTQLSVEEMKHFLERDTNGWFVLISLARIRMATKNFASEQKFLQSMLQIFQGKSQNKKIKLKKIL